MKDWLDIRQDYLEIAKIVKSLFIYNKVNLRRAQVC